ncbi:hypothetical protein FS837_011116 [Tulasnella sp. UAMH 9824]|nr:hypothetical protein FS837_011116 [Tulasnella sp. UAMH 9824]
MADVRALLKAKTKERAPQIQHPYAAYNASGQLRCSLCATPIKFNNPAAWKTHLESKSHKQMVEREKSSAKGKRKAEEEMEVDSDGGSKKRRVSPDAQERSKSPSAGPSGFPADFFSDPSRAPPELGMEDDEEESAAKPSRPTAGPSVDSEFEAFERAIAAASAKRAPTASQDIFARATVFAEAELVDVDAIQANGFPPEVSSTDGPSKAGGAAPPAEEEEETEAQKARRKELEEKELIMDRIIEEERAQEEADDKVRSLKARLEAIKKQRELKKKATSESSMKS